MRASPLIVTLAVFLAGAHAHADMVADGEKGVKLSIHVDAQVPAGKLLVLANTFRGADIIKPGEDQAIEWHPMAGAMQLRMISDKDAGKLAALREALDRDKAQKLIQSGAVCAPPFDGIRTISDTLLAAEIRWTYRVAFADRGCQPPVSAKLSP